MAKRTGEVTIRFNGDAEGKQIWDYVRTLGDESKEIFYQAIDELGKVGEDVMRQKIERTGSKYARSGLKKKLGFSKPGRIRTGAMYKSVASRPRRGDKVYQVEVGYLKDYQEYFKWQEIGFTNIWKFFGQWDRPYSTAPNAPVGWMFRRLRTGAPKVEGLFALKDARDKVDSESSKIFAKAGRRIERLANKK